jgi:hypothetical protein
LLVVSVEPSRSVPLIEGRAVFEGTAVDAAAATPAQTAASVSVARATRTGLRFMEILLGWMISLLTL